MFSISLKKLFLFIFLLSALNANEVKLYALQKYNLDYDKQTQEIQTKIAQEYQNNHKLFKEFVQKFSVDIKTKKNHGELGWLEEKHLKPEVKKALKNAKKGDIVKVFIEDDGLQVLYVEDYLALTEASFEEAKMVLIQVSTQEALQKEIQKLL